MTAQPRPTPPPRVTPQVPARYDVEISHRRRDPLEYGFTQRSNTWLIDLDAVPQLPRAWRWLVAFRGADHLGEAGGSIRANVDAFLRGNGIGSPARILMLANPRVLGYVFNPLTVFYCLGPDGTVHHLIAEVRNTYGGRHSYLLTPDSDGRAQTAKAFYVSPFYPVDGEYTMALPKPDERLLVNVTLHRAGERPFAAVMAGQRSASASLWSALRTPLATRSVMLGIKRHGIRLYSKGLRPCPRPTEPSIEPSTDHSGEPMTTLTSAGGDER